MAKPTQIIFPIKKRIINGDQSIGRAWVTVTKHSNGYYTTLWFNNGNHADGPHIYKTKAAAIKRAELMRTRY